jgi:hypothetical protein
LTVLSLVTLTGCQTEAAKKAMAERDERVAKRVAQRYPVLLFLTAHSRQKNAKFFDTFRQLAALITEQQSVVTEMELNAKLCRVTNQVSGD